MTGDEDSLTTHRAESYNRASIVRQMRGQNPEETGGVYADIRRGFPKGDNEAYDVLVSPASIFPNQFVDFFH